MVSTLIILLASGLSLFLVWTVLRPGYPPIKSIEDWEARRRQVDPEVFRLLLDPAEERYLRQSFSSQQFRVLQRQRMALALRSLHLVGENTVMLMKLGQLAKAEGNPQLAKQAEDLTYAALRLRVNLQLAQPCLWLKWLLPGWSWSIPAVEIPYEELLTYLNRIRQQRQGELSHALMAS